MHRTCALAREWLGTSCSPKTLHARVQEKGAALQFTPQPQTRVLLTRSRRCGPTCERFIRRHGISSVSGTWSTLFGRYPTRGKRRHYARVWALN